VRPGLEHESGRDDIPLQDLADGVFKPGETDDYPES
jgi:hypothetical protein